jgi:hypothetical protein
MRSMNRFFCSLRETLSQTSRLPPLRAVLLELADRLEALLQDALRVHVRRYCAARNPGARTTSTSS